MVPGIASVRLASLYHLAGKADLTFASGIGATGNSACNAFSV